MMTGMIGVSFEIDGVDSILRRITPPRRGEPLQTTTLSFLNRSVARSRVSSRLQKQKRT
jgi:hypothetical protein